MEDYNIKPIRILAVDDEEDVIESYRGILGANQNGNIFSDINAEGNELFGDNQQGKNENHFELITCQQGDEAVETVQAALDENNPFSVAFIDVRMPPGPDGVWVAKQIHSLDPCMNIVIVTAYSDVPPQTISKDFLDPGKLFYIQKPFHWDEIYQFAIALGENWKIQKELGEQFAAIENRNCNADFGLNQQHHIKEILAQKINFEEELNLKTQQIEDTNTALRVLLKEKERDKAKIEENIQFNINEYISPYIQKLRKTELTARQDLIISTIEKNLTSITSSFSSHEAPKHLNFTPVELQVAKLIKHGHTTKDIADMLNLSILTVESYRKNIRKKMGLTNKKENLRTTLLEYL